MPPAQRLRSESAFARPAPSPAQRLGWASPGSLVDMPGASTAPPHRTGQRPGIDLGPGIVLGGAALFVTVAAAVAWLVPQSLGDRPATCLTGADARCFCEAVTAGLLRQPANALSSLAFCVAAAVALRPVRPGGPGRPDGSRKASGTVRTRHTPEDVLARIAALVLLSLGVASLTYHAQLSFAGQVLDVQGMYLLGALLVTGALWRHGRISASRATLLAAALVAALLAGQLVFPDARRWLFAVVLVPGVALEVKLAGRSRPLTAAVLTLLAGYAVWLADDRGLWCEPASWVQGHAVWHLLTAVSGGLLVPHYRATATEAAAPAAAATEAAATDTAVPDGSS